MPPTSLRHPGRLSLVLVLGCVSLAACAPKAPADLPPAPTAPPSVTTNSPSGMLQGPVPGSAADFLAAIAGQDTIHFDLDKFNIDQTSTSILSTQAQWLARYPGKHATIEGHADERGTRDYNLALGERRANAAKNYLVSLGIDASRLSTISYGKERPIAMGSNEEAWAKNRRAVTVAID